MKHTFLSLLFCALACASALHAATINVTPGSGTLRTAVTNAAAGDELVLTTGEYNETATITTSVPLTIKAAEGTQPVVKTAKRIEINADFTLEDVTFICTYHLLQVTATAPINFSVHNCVFRMGTGSANENRAIYIDSAPMRVKNVRITDCTFDGGANGAGRFIYVYPGDNIAALEGSVEIDHCTFYNCTNTRGVYPANIDNTHITNCIFMNPEERDNTNSFAVYGSNSYVHNCLSFNAPVKVGTGGSQAKCKNRNPYFVDPANGNFQLFANSPAVNMGTDGSNIGDPRWGVSSDEYDTSGEPYIPYKQPYSMAPTTNSVKILWQMSEENGPTNAVIYYGTDPANLNQSISSSSGWNVEEEGYVHVVTLTDLQPNTRYYFTVGASDTRRFDKVCSTKTAPEQGTAYRIFSISDIHGNARNNWSNMQDFICSLNCDIALMNGDFVSSKGNDRNWNNYYFKPGEPFLGQVPCMSSPGNHETGDPRGLRWSSFYDYFHQFAHEGASEGDTIDPRGESYFHFVYGNADVVVLNLNFDESSPKFRKGCRQYQWLDSVLNTSSRPWIIVCHHVGIYTSGYHGQWSEEPKQAAPLLEKYAAAPYNKRIISLSGDDHSFEHLYKDGVHYLRPGCGRDANYDQQKQIKDYKYSMYYRRVSCFSTLDMSADASSIALTAYDSVGNPFYTYTFLHDNEVITPAVNFTVPANEVSTEDSILLRWCTFDPAGDAIVSLYCAQTPDLTDPASMTPMATNLPASTEKYMWHTRNIFPKGKYYLYAFVTSGGKTYQSNSRPVVNLLEDTTPPPAPTAMMGYKNNEQYLILWQNPTRPIHIDNPLTDFSEGIDKIETNIEEGSSMQISNDNGTLKCDYGITAAWATAAADYVFDEPVDMHQTPVLSFRMKGNGTSTAVRLVCKNMANNHEDWWYTEKFTLAKNTWQTYTVDLRTLSAFDWYGNTDERNQCEGLVRISFGVSTGEPISGTFYLDDLSLGGDVLPAPDYAQTVIVRNDNAFPTSPTDGTEIYRGTEEHCFDPTAVVGQIYYYGAFAADDRNNWSAPETSAQWKSENVEEGDAIDIVRSNETPQKFIQNGQIFLRYTNNTYSILGIKVE